VKVLFGVAFDASLKSAVAVFALAIDTGLAFTVKSEETIKASVDAAFVLEKLGSFALEAGVGAVAVEAVLLAVVAGHVGSEESSNGAFIMADVVVKQSRGNTLGAESGVLLAFSASVDQTLFLFVGRGLSSLSGHSVLVAVVFSSKPSF